MKGQESGKNLFYFKSILEAIMQFKSQIEKTVPDLSISVHLNSLPSSQIAFKKQRLRTVIKQTLDFHGALHYHLLTNNLIFLIILLNESKFSEC